MNGYMHSMALRLLFLSLFFAANLSAAGEAAELGPWPKPGAMQLQTSAYIVKVAKGVEALGKTGRKLGLTEGAGLRAGRILSATEYASLAAELRKSGLCTEVRSPGLPASEGVPAKLEEKETDKAFSFELTVQGKRDADQIGLDVSLAEKDGSREGSLATGVAIPLGSAVALGGTLNGTYRIVLLRIAGPVTYWPDVRREIELAKKRREARGAR